MRLALRNRSNRLGCILSPDDGMLSFLSYQVKFPRRCITLIINRTLCSWNVKLDLSVIRQVELFYLSDWMVGNSSQLRPYFGLHLAESDHHTKYSVLHLYPQQSAQRALWVTDTTQVLTVGTWQPLAHLHDGRSWLVPASIASWLLCAIPHTLQDSVLDALGLARSCTLHIQTHKTADARQHILMEVDYHLQSFPLSFRYAQ
jgi:hypothetical protein